MTYDGREIANFVLDFCYKNEVAITNLSLQKILYFCHAYCLVRLDRPLIRHEFEAWEHGPVLPYVYHEFKDYVKSPIVSKALKLDLASGEKVEALYKLDAETETLLADVVNFYCRVPAWNLVKMTHEKNSPWDVVYYHTDKTCPGMKISNNSIKEYYAKANGDYTFFGNS